MFQSYPWYIADWRTSETRLSLNLAERGLYRELLDYCYLEGSLPEDRDRIKLISGADGHDFARAWNKVRSLFELVSTPNGNRFVHPKVNDVRAKLFTYHEQKKHAGVKSGQSRRQRALNVRSTAVEPSPTPTPTPTPAPEPVKVKPFSPTGVGAEEQTPVLFPVEDKRGTAWFDASFSRWYQQYWCKTGKADASKAYEKRIKALVKNGGTHEASERFLVSEAAEDRKRFEGTDDWDWRVKLHPATWLNGARWEDQPAPPPPPMSKFDAEWGGARATREQQRQAQIDEHWGGARATR